ncbi:amino acid racemase [Serpentinicella sp. ANB-PHB4]|uniref:aspartate/glutamate racemase family protein n=1 Tax=Serpentinicella sp. ANB-PHB4 TaxID=3074076 RepID=UPI0028602098|nr:amino acid racemase [Serpentinicella sp. ANB-PHB4]MDR5658754.1 amino acid racemase [Serpentinicella sp. ANB-PHB4]
MKEKIIGILGGMGPDATHEIFSQIIKYTKAKTDNDHIRVIIDSNSKIPDRTKAILNTGESPERAMLDTAINLENAGADFIVIPCMTAHYFLKKVQEGINIPIFNGLELTNQYIKEKYKHISNIGLIATTGTIKTELFQKSIDDKKIIIPNPSLQEEVMDIIYGVEGIKAGNQSKTSVDRIKRVIHELQRQFNIEAVIAGCTEIGLVLKQDDVSIPLIDPITVLAQNAVNEAGKNLNLDKDDR